MIAKPIVTLAALGTITLAGCSSNGPLHASQSTVSMPLTASTGNPVSQYIKHVVIIIQENRTFDNFFAGYPGADAPTYGYAGKKEIPLKPITFQTHINLPHVWAAAMTDWDNGKMDGFYKFGIHNEDQAYSYVERSQLKPYWTMARRYVLADHMFPTEFGPSWTGHLTLVAGTDNVTHRVAVADFSNGPWNSCDSPAGSQVSTINWKHKYGLHNGPFPCFYQFNTMAESLDAAGDSWKYYVTKKRHAGIWSAFEAIKYVRYGSDWINDIIAPQTLVLNDITSGNLPAVSWVTPSKIDSDHPEGHSDRGPSWVSAIVNEIGKSQYWNSTAIIVVWDDWGGWYDNVPPPQLDFRGLGIRVPCLIISPYAKQGYISHTQYEFGSILKFVEEAFNLPPLGQEGGFGTGYTDIRSNSIVDSFDFTQTPRPFKRIRAPYPPSTFRNEPPSDEPVDEQ